MSFNDNTHCSLNGSLRYRRSTSSSSLRRCRRALTITAVPGNKQTHTEHICCVRSSNYEQLIWVPPPCRQTGRIYSKAWYCREEKHITAQKAEENALVGRWADFRLRMKQTEKIWCDAQELSICSSVNTTRHAMAQFMNPENLRKTFLKSLWKHPCSKTVHCHEPGSSSAQF